MDELCAQLIPSEENEPGQQCEQRDVVILQSMPGLGRIILAVLLAEVWQPLRRRDYHALRSLSGVAPVTRRSGKTSVTANAVRRRDGGGTLATVASRETRGLHGGNRLATFYDEVGGFRDSDLFTALAPDPHRASECLTYVTGYRGVHEGPGLPDA